MEEDPHSASGTRLLGDYWTDSPVPPCDSCFRRASTPRRAPRCTRRIRERLGMVLAMLAWFLIVTVMLATIVK